MILNEKESVEDLNIKVRYHFDQCEHNKIISFSKDGDWIDLRCAKTEYMKKGEYRRIKLGVSIELPKGYYAMIAPRSSTFEKLNLYAPNGISVIDNTYCGDDDIWHFLCCASDATVIHAGSRICQFSIFKAMDPAHVKLTVANKLFNPNRGGVGHSGIM